MEPEAKDRLVAKIEDRIRRKASAGERSASAERRFVPVQWTRENLARLIFLMRVHGKPE